MCRYNVFNHYFFDGPKARIVYEEFLNAGNPNDLLVVIDPPFGGLVEVIQFTLQQIKSDVNNIDKEG